MTEALNALAQRMGIEPEYRDVRGEVIRATAETKRLLLAAMGVPVEGEADARAALDALERDEWRHALPPVLVLHDESADPAIELTLPAGTREVTWRIDLEDGSSRTSRYSGSMPIRWASAFSASVMPVPP